MAQEMLGAIAGHHAEDRVHARDEAEGKQIRQPVGLDHTVSAAERDSGIHRDVDARVLSLEQRVDSFCRGQRGAFDS